MCIFCTDLEEKLKTSNEFANLLKNDLNEALKENEKLRKFAQNYEKLEQMCQTKSHRLLNKVLELLRFYF